MDVFAVKMNENIAASGQSEELYIIDLHVRADSTSGVSPEVHQYRYIKGTKNIQSTGISWQSDQGNYVWQSDLSAISSCLAS